MLIIGHRGCGVEPENTVRAIVKGMECADLVEIDVRTSKDKELVVIHDSTLERTTNGKGLVRDFTLAELKKLDAGKEERIPTLKEVLDLVNNGLIVEIKEEGSEEKICSVIKEKGFENIILVSFSPKALVNAKKILQVRTGLIFSRALEAIRLALSIKANAILPRFDLASRELVEKAHRHNLKVFAWTLNTEEEFRKAMEMGLDGFASDDPCLARRSLYYPTINSKRLNNFLL